ncbi:MEP-1 like protein [Aulographum hederae CBS 113979]|uniref:MEP-1 like protein n=1 Tax=Aulographum hederae CBS 113979 TaxID=1176131 RepID=A0A6G1HAB9_9PEZI|nr:MEP-1 like protein [Aulographum hederae CBS 113979]
MQAAANETVFAMAGPTVKIYAHVVTTSAKSGKYSQTMINNQIAAMNKAYNPYTISFTLAGTDFTVNNQWATGSDSTELAMKKALRKGTYADLNLYFVSDLGGGLLGFCYFPTTVSSGSTDFYLDGCVNLADSLPGGTATNYNQGGTAVHESGHWFGLFHVFQGSSCSGSGDMVSDTPIQKTATSGCPSSQDSCPNQSGLDSIHNYMDYSYDQCYTQFTAGQQTRMLQMYSQYRAGK